MIKLRSPLEIKGLPGNRWELFFDTGELFSETTPFRDYLELIRKTLAQDAPASLTLPPAHGFDDCVEGELVWNGEPFAIYFERALSYLTLSSASEHELRRALDLIRPLTAVA